LFFVLDFRFFSKITKKTRKKTKEKNKKKERKKAAAMERTFTQDELENIASSFMTPEEIKTCTTKNLDKIVRKYLQEHQQKTRQPEDSVDESHPPQYTTTESAEKRRQIESLWPDFLSSSPSENSQDDQRKQKTPTVSVRRSTSSSGPTSIYLPEKTVALQQVIEQINKEFGKCNEKIKKIIEQVTIFHTAQNQKILSNSFSAEEREYIYALSKQSHMEKYQQLYKQFVDIYRERGQFISSIYQADTSLKNIYDYVEGKQQVLGDLLRKYKVIMGAADASPIPPF
jgi:hypothetical protein